MVPSNFVSHNLYINLVVHHKIVLSFWKEQSLSSIFFFYFNCQGLSVSGPKHILRVEKQWSVQVWILFPRMVWTAFKTALQVMDGNFLPTYADALNDGTRETTNPIRIKDARHSKISWLWPREDVHCRRYWDEFDPERDLYGWPSSRTDLQLRQSCVSNLLHFSVRHRRFRKCCR